MGIGLITFTYQDGVDYSPIAAAESNLQKTCYVVDAPLDKQIELGEVLGDGDIFVAVNFVTAEEIGGYKQAKRDELTGAANDENDNVISEGTNE